jgi:beta-glucosidase
MDLRPQRPLYLDTSQPLERRVDDLVARLTLEEKITQTLHAAKAVERLGIPEYNWWNECLHGVARAGSATVFPQTIGMAAAFDRELLFRVASAIGDEARAKHHEAVREGNRGIYRGLTFWTPNINIFRDPRWGRGQETYGEDPYLTAELGTALVRGLQGNHPRYLKVSACAKHFAVHSGPEGLRHVFDARVSPKDLEETYLPAFRALVQAGVESVMGAYNRTNGEPCCGSQALLVDTLRGKWGFKGHVVSDCGAIDDFHEQHKVTASPAESAALAIKMGCDLNCGCTYEALGEAVEKGLLSEADIDRSLRRLFATRFKLGLFDDSSEVPFASVSVEVVRCPKHLKLAREIAAKSVVVLKNEGGVLPIRESAKNIFVLGPTAADADVLVGNYYGLSPVLVTLLEGVVAKTRAGQTVEYRKGCRLTEPNVNPIDWVTGGAASADVAIACFGTSPVMEGEEGEAVASDYFGDRRQIGLPEHQVKMLRRLREAGAKTVLVLTGGSAIDLVEVEPLVSAIVFVWYPGEQGGHAVADTLFGDVNPSGRLPVTFPRSLAQLPPFEDYSMVGRTYRYLTEEPMYPFGFGLSYTRFQYHQLTLESSKVPVGEPVVATVSVSNAGDRAGDEVVQLYLYKMDASVRVPIQQLCGFQRVPLRPGERREVRFEITPDQLSIVNNAGERVQEPGKFLITAGGASPGARSLACGAPAPVEATLEYY